MDISFVIDQLEANGPVFDAMLRPVPEMLRQWRPRPDHWCLLEIVCHLYDEERDDFAARLRSVLTDPSAPLPRTDPQAWLTERRYMGQDYGTMLDGFLAERRETVRWLRGLEDPKWTNAFQHPTYGPLTARMFLVNWLAHDLLHIRQITKVKFLYLQAESGEPLEYAGTW